MYITYEQYKNYGGTLDEATFNEYEFEARSWVNWYTFNRLENDDVSENEKVFSHSLPFILCHFSRWLFNQILIAEQLVKARWYNGIIVTKSVTINRSFLMGVP